MTNSIYASFLRIFFILFLPLSLFCFCLSFLPLILSIYHRAVNTAELIAKELPYKLKIYKDNWLREKEFGRLHGLNEKTVSATTFFFAFSFSFSSLISFPPLFTPHRCVRNFHLSMRSETEMENTGTGFRVARTIVVCFAFFSPLSLFPPFSLLPLLLFIHPSSSIDVEMRIHCFLEKLSRDYAGRSVMVVTHQVCNI